MKLPILSVFLFLTIGFASSTDIVSEDNEALQYITQIERVSATPGGLNQFLGVGTLITFQHVLTTRLILADLSPRDVVIRFRSYRLGSGFTARPTNITHHATANIAIARMSRRVDQQFTFAPRWRSTPVIGRFCTMQGFDRVLANRESAGFMVETFLLMTNATDLCTLLFPPPNPNPYGPLCSIGRPNEFSNSCNGFLGAPVSCDGESISAMVTHDSWCNATHPLIRLVTLSDFEEWINQNTNKGGRNEFSAIFIALISSILMKLFY
jgi:hypothetical protein